MVTGHSHNRQDTARAHDTRLRFASPSVRPAGMASASADRLSRTSLVARGVYSFPLRVRTFSAAAAVMAVTWAAAGEIPSAAQPSSGHIVTTEQYGILLLLLGVTTAVPTINAVLGWFGFGKQRQLTPQPVRVQAEPSYLERQEYEKIAAGCAAERRQAIENARADREAIQRQIDFLSGAIRQELKEHNAAAAERADVLHERISKQLEPFGAVRQRLDDHIHDERAHAPFNPAGRPA